MKLLRRFLQTICLSFLAFYNGSYAANIIIINQDSFGEGLNDGAVATPIDGNSGETIGQQRQMVLEFAAKILESIFDLNVDIFIDAEFMPLGDNTLGGAAAYYGYSHPSLLPKSNIFYPPSLANQILGYDVRPTTSDLFMEFDSDTSWYLGFGNPPSNQYSLLYIALHEIIHGLGFAPKFDKSDGSWVYGIPDIFSTFVEDRDSLEFWSLMSNSSRALSILNDPNVCWSGENVKEKSSQLQSGFCQYPTSKQVRIHSPLGIETGSSGSHFSPDVFPNEIMEPAVGQGIKFSTLGLSEDVLVDIGWPTFSNGDKPVLADLDNENILNTDSLIKDLVIYDNDNPLHSGSSSVFEMIVSINSSNQSVVSNSSITIDGFLSGQSNSVSSVREMTISPVSGVSGSTVISVSVIDPDGNISQESFNLVVENNDNPVINISDPSDGQLVFTSNQIFDAVASDAEDGVLNSIIWAYRTADTTIDDFILVNNGSPLTGSWFASLPDDTYIIAACVRDSADQLSCDGVTITIFALGDNDNDGLNNNDEVAAGSNPYDSDTDDDGLLDGNDAQPLVPSDFDQDGVDDANDNCYSVSNNNQDNLDGDAFGDICDLDIDGDGFSNNIEKKFGTDPLNNDSSAIRTAIDNYSSQAEPEKNVPMMGFLGLILMGSSILALVIFRRRL